MGIIAKTIKEIADEFGVSKQAVRKKLDANFRSNYVQTVTRNGVQTLVIVNSGYLLLKKHFIGGNNQKPNGGTFTSNTGNNNQATIELLNQQIAIKDNQIKEKDEQLKSMQKLLDQSQQLQLMNQKKDKLNSIPVPGNSKVNVIEKSIKKWWHFW
ncbi:DUF536 domain-containing protein [Lactiplantibacillus plantarum]|nr:DUF536 domain-containing protein [Levilactobacillus mulengensis]